ncbi:MAG TPA: 3-oxoadipate enol-lactonase [Ilumatobacteraceae bacterium]|nr:3-oxoadipate enol-lactonase [Ilumatobacteraceae bacterium]
MTLFATTPTGTRIAYDTAGRPWRPALILTHSLGSDHRMWQPQVQALKSQYFVVAIDNVGHGESGVPEGDYAVSDLAAAVLAVAEATDLERFHYCGLSVGGLTGQWLGAHQPDRLISLTLSNTAAKIGTAELWDERIRIARTEGMGALVDGVIARWFSPEFAQQHPELFTQARATLLATDPNGYAGVSAALRDTDLRESAGSIGVPTMVIGGLSDQATPVEQARWLHEQISGSRLVELDAAHLSNLDRESEFTAALDGFLAEMTP